MSRLKDQEQSSLDTREIRLAQDSARLLQGSMRHSLKIQINEQVIDLPASMTSIVGSCLEIMAEGNSVAVLPIDKEIGTQEAADLLGVSRPYLVKLLDSNAVPSRKVGVQRRVKVADILSYQQREKEARRQVLAELAAEGQRLELGE